MTSIPTLTKQRSVAAALVVGLLTASACTVEDSVPAPSCQSGESAMIAAQSVPSAELIPCLSSLPAGWEVDTTKIGEAGTVITLDSDRAGDGAARLRYHETCKIGDAVGVTSGHPGADAFEYVEQVEPGFKANRYFLFEGGCVWWEFDFDSGVSGALSIEIGHSLGLVARDWLNQNISETFIDEEL